VKIIYSGRGNVDEVASWDDLEKASTLIDVPVDGLFGTQILRNLDTKGSGQLTHRQRSVGDYHPSSDVCQNIFRLRVQLSQLTTVD
jgi:hypothetical protein